MITSYLFFMVLNFLQGQVSLLTEAGGMAVNAYSGLFPKNIAVSEGCVKPAVPYIPYGIMDYTAQFMLKSEVKTAWIYTAVTVYQKK